MSGSYFQSLARDSWAPPRRAPLPLALPSEVFGEVGCSRMTLPLQHTYDSFSVILHQAML